MSASKLNTANDSNDNMCVVCFKNVNIYSIGICDHPVCFECSTRMRVLCRQNECPICRQDMPKVIFCKYIDLFRKLKMRLSSRNPNQQLEDRKFGIQFDTYQIQSAYYHLLEHTCKLCKNLPPFRNFAQLKEHMRRDHELYYCDLCVENLRIFTWERKCYTRAELAQHRRKGDSDDTSHRGHPLCQFCDTRYMDSDELFRHLRRDHLFCHFCDADGLHQYYPTYESLRQHFQQEHYLCEEGDCLHEKFTSVFRSEIDIKAHRASVHTKHLGKAATKQARMLELEFTLAPRPRPDLPAARRKQLGYYDNRSPPYEDESVPSQPPETSHSVQLTAQDFPSLSGAAPTVPLMRAPHSLTIKHMTSKGAPGNLTRNDQNFPALSSEMPTSSGTVRLNVHNSVGGNIGSSLNHPPNFSIQVTNRNNGAITTHISSQSSGVKIRPPSSKDFPALGSASVPEAQWVKPSTSQTKETRSSARASKIAPAPVLPSRNNHTDFPSLGKSDNKKEEFPSLGKGDSKSKNEKTKKTSSVTVPVSDVWSGMDVSSKDKGKNNKKKSNKCKGGSGPNDTGGGGSEDLNKNQKSKPNSSKVESNQKNGVVKKRSELKIDSLQINDTNVMNGNDFPVLGTNKLPPGFNTQPPPGFSANNLTFTSSSGQRYSIVPQRQFVAPADFSQRNQILVERFLSAIGDSNRTSVHEFKQYSSMFRNGDYSPEDYYHHCKEVLGNEFSDIFPELLALLPDIERQQQLYTHHLKLGGSSRHLEVCATCNQVVASSDLRSHLAAHSLDNHFPVLGAQEISSVWKK